MRRNFEWPKLLTADGRGIAFGGDYNPDQWSEDIWDDDIRLMKQAGVNTVALAIFSWDRIQPTEDRWDFGWLDRIIDKLGNAGIAVDLASATATAPLWLYESHPEVLPRDKYGHPVNAGSRQSWSPTSPVFKEYALTLCRKLAERYGTNPYVTAWHMGNEYGWNNREDYSDNALDAFRAWCRRKYGTIGALNQAWGTTFWGQEMNGFDEVLIPRFMGADSMVNPGQKLDFERFGNDMLLDFYKAERDAIAEICPDKPFTTNFMVSTDQCCMDYAAWAEEVNFVSNDHYFHEGESHLDELACSDALMDSLALGKPWYVMEHSTSAVQWKPLNTRKRKGETVRDSLAHVAMGADAINFFQWRASAFGAEAFHSAMVPHAGEDTKLFRQVCELGASLHTLADAGVQGTDYESYDLSKRELIVTAEQQENRTADVSTYMNFANAYQGQALSLANTPELNEFAMNSLTAFQAAVEQIDIPVVKCPEIDNWAAENPDIASQKEQMEVSYVVGEISKEDLEAFLNDVYFPSVADAEAAYIETMNAYKAANG